MVGVLDLARHPDVRRIELAWALSIVGWTSCTVAVLVLAYDEGGAALLAAYSVGRAVWGAVVAVAVSSLGDLVRRDRLLRATTGARAVLVGSAAAVAVVEGPVALVVVAVVLADGLAGIVRPLQAAALPWLVRTPAELATANVTATVMESAGSLVGPVLAGLTLLLADAPTALALSAACTALALASLLRLRLPDDSRHARVGRPTMVRDVVVGGAAMARLQPVGGLPTLALVQTVARGVLMVGLVVFAFDVLHLGESSIGWLNAAMGVGGLLGGLIGVYVVRSTRLGRTFVAGVLAWGLALGLMAAWPVPAVAFAAMVLIGVGNAHQDASMFTLLPRLAGPRLIGRLLGALELLIVVGIGLGSVLAPWLLDTVGARGGFAVAAGLVVVAALGYAVPFGRVDRSLPEPGHEVELLRALPMFAPLPLVTVEQLAASLEVCHYPPGAVLIRQGDAGDRFHVVADGRVDVDVDGRPRPPLGPGDCFGEIALMRQVPRTATITAATDVTTYALGRAEFLRAVTGNQRSASFAASLVDRRLAGDQQAR